MKVGRMRIDLGPGNPRLVYCGYCGRQMQDGTGEPFFGMCVECEVRISAQRQRQHMRAKREVDRKGPAQEMWPEDEVFDGFDEGDE